LLAARAAQGAIVSLELYTRTIAPVLPRKLERRNSFSFTGASRIEGKLTYFKLIIKAPCPPRSAVPVNRGGAWGGFFHSVPLRIGRENVFYEGHFRRPGRRGSQGEWREFPRNRTAVQLKVGS